MAPPDDDSAPSGLGTPGWNPLFVAVLITVGIAIAAGAAAGTAKPATALHSNFIFRVEVAVVVAFAWYWAAGALWLAWHRTLFERMGLGNAGTLTPKQNETIEQRDEQVEKAVQETTETLENFRQRIEALEDQADSSS
jgi:hypothetical protein